MRRCLVVLIVGLIGGLAGCSSPASKMYTLRATATPAAGAGPCNCTVVVGPVSVPAIDNVPEIVSNVGPNQVHLDEFNRWASPLQDNMVRVVAENLVTLLGTPQVTVFQQAVKNSAEYHVTIDVQNLESILGESADMTAIWMVRRTKDGQAQTGRTTVHEPLTQAGYPPLIAAHNRSMLKMSEDIAAAVRTFAQSPP